jgi:hypothetical protein
MRRYVLKSLNARLRTDARVNNEINDIT